jgi:hypothetical protein
LFGTIFENAIADSHDLRVFGRVKKAGHRDPLGESTDNSSLPAAGGGHA